MWIRVPFAVFFPHHDSMQATDSLLQPVFDHPSFQNIVTALSRSAGECQELAGLTRTAKAVVLVGLAHYSQKPLLVLTSCQEEAEILRETAAALLDWVEPGEGSSVIVLPPFDRTPYDGRSPHAELSERRAVTLWSIARRRARIVFAPAPAALGRFREAVYYRSLALEIKTGEEISPGDLIEHLAASGYDSQEPVDAPGSYSVRGGIIDVYPPETEWPFRIEFSGDQIESLREFDPATQRTCHVVSSASLLPLSEHQRSRAFFDALTRNIASRSAALGPTARGPEVAPQYSNPFPGWEFYAPLVEPHPFSLFQLFHSPLVVWDEAPDVELQIKLMRESLEEAYDEVRDVVPSPPRPEDFLLSDHEFRSALAPLAQVSLKELEVESVSPSDGMEVAQRKEAGNYDIVMEMHAEPPICRWALASQPPPKFNGSLKAWMEDLNARRARGERVVIALSAAGKMERLGEALKDYQIPFTVLPLSKGAEKPPGARLVDADASLLIVRGHLAEGVVFPELRLALLAETDLFGEFTWGGPARPEKSAVSRLLSDLSDLKAGDYVVHVDHGIGLYQGLRQIEVTGERRDFMLLTYQDDARLYVPLERLDLVEKYRTAGDSVKPPLDRLGGATWARTKMRVKHALRDMTAELLKLYAERKMSGGIAFSADTPWQREFEDAFEYEETPDQLKALEEIKKDLESPQPMDRLLCGDVGYGKTELAMRAAFKVVQDGKQVAVLAPTTVLAFQHFTTFRQRMAAFPVRIEMVSRFRSAAEQKRIVEEAAEGKVEILIGTHRMLSKDVNFQSLGLLIVDEEQRFGVSAKEKLKRLRANVDVLTMSATPIPRTLHMSLGGLRDLSVIETPPRGRLAIQTTVAPFTARLIQTALLQELERQGQVYFVHNRVESIFSMAAMLQRLAPVARIGVAHGQMAVGELERVMMKFVRGEYDVLVSTAIIENGLDIPRANTIVINRADRFGLAELYQLRGRVGRSDRRAYAYLLIQEEDSLSPLARRRLAALKEFSDLGAGFRLAALDLELRGTGNILGAEQSGHLNAIGLDLYLKMLEQTVEELKGLPVKPEVHATLNLGVDIKIPEEYIADEGQRLRMYKRISGLPNAEARAELEAELADRYGALPPSVMTLLDYGLLKSRAEEMLVQSVERKLDEVWVRFHPETPIPPEHLTRFVRRRRDASLRPDGSLRFRMKHVAASPITELTSALQELQAGH